MLQIPTPLFRPALSGRHPPTGKMLAKHLETEFAGWPFLAELARLSGRSETAVAWLLQQDIVIPAGLLCAALTFQSAMEVRGDRR